MPLTPDPKHSDCPAEFKGAHPFSKVDVPVCHPEFVAYS